MKNNFLKTISYNPFFVKAAKFFHIRSVLRKIYYLLFCPKDKLLKVDFSGIDAMFYVKSPDELRLIESVAGDEGEKKVLALLLSLMEDGDVFYDIGANVGIYSILAAKKVGGRGKVVSFEPEKKSLIEFKENIKINGIKNILVVDRALGEENSTGKLHISGTTGNFSLVNIYDKESKVETVEIIKGDDFVNKHSIPVPKAVKVDVEGYEYSVLAGLRNTLANPACKVICCEIHVGLFPEGITEEKTIGLIESFGFRKIEIFRRPFTAYHLIAQKT
jgi:FkbM family methyltransferase